MTVQKSFLNLSLVLLLIGFSKTHAYCTNTMDPKNATDEQKQVIAAYLAKFKKIPKTFTFPDGTLLEVASKNKTEIYVKGLPQTSIKSLSEAMLLPEPYVIPIVSMTAIPFNLCQEANGGFSTELIGAAKGKLFLNVDLNNPNNIIVNGVLGSQTVEEYRLAMDIPSTTDIPNTYGIPHDRVFTSLSNVSAKVTY